MSLDLKEQLDVQNGTLKPTSVEDGILELTQASGINYARDFMVSYKVFPRVDIDGNPINVEAGRYIDKMVSACNQMIRAKSDGFNSLRISMASMIANVAQATPELIEGLSPDVWYDFINDNMESCVELFASVLIEEKTAYDAI